MTELTDDDLGKQVVTDDGTTIGTLRRIDHPTLYLQLADDIDDKLRSDMKISETTAKRHEGEILAGATMASVETVTDDEIRFWPAYASEADHESVTYDDIPKADSHPEEGL